jgi:sortase A
MKEKVERLQQINRITAYVIYGLCILVILSPYLPGVSYFISKNITHANSIVPESDIDLSVDAVIISKINVNSPVIEASTMKVVHEKVWRRPQDSTPDKGSNTVLVAHRYATIGGNRASTFYNLPELVIGDKVEVIWKGKLYTYEVYNTMTVEPTAVQIEDPTTEPILTLYTCTPLWKADHRFVVQARLINTK